VFSQLSMLDNPSQLRTLKSLRSISLHLGTSALFSSDNLACYGRRRWVHTQKASPQAQVALWLSKLQAQKAKGRPPTPTSLEVPIELLSKP
jgi:hypothetical protein